MEALTGVVLQGYVTSDGSPHSPRIHSGRWDLENGKIVQAREGVGMVTSQLCPACFKYLKLQLSSLLLPPLLFVY
jgi:hypothetical protein